MMRTTKYFRSSVVLCFYVFFPSFVITYITKCNICADIPILTQTEVNINRNVKSSLFNIFIPEAPFHRFERRRAITKLSAVDI